MASASTLLSNPSSLLQPTPPANTQLPSSGGSSTRTGWNRLSSAESLAMVLLYSSSVVAPMTRASPRLKAAFIMLEMSMPPMELPAQSGLHYFSLVPTSNQRRWDQIKQDKVISLVWNNTELDLSDATFTLYMTLSSSAAV